MNTKITLCAALVSLLFVLMGCPHPQGNNPPTADDDIFSTPQKALKQITYSLTPSGSNTGRSATTVNPDDYKVFTASVASQSYASIFSSILKTNISTYEELTYGETCSLKNFTIDDRLFDTSIIRPYLKEIFKNTRYEAIRINKDSEDQVSVNLYAQMWDGESCSPFVLHLIMTRDNHDNVSTTNYFYIFETEENISTWTLVNQIYEVYNVANAGITYDYKEEYRGESAIDNKCHAETIDGAVFNLYDYNHALKTYTVGTNTGWWNGTSAGIDYLSMKKYGIVYWKGRYGLPALNLKGTLASDIELSLENFESATLAMEGVEATTSELKEFFFGDNDNTDFDPGEGRLVITAEEKAGSEKFFSVKKDVAAAMSTAKQLLDSPIWNTFEADMAQFDFPVNKASADTAVKQWLLEVIN